MKDIADSVTRLALQVLAFTFSYVPKFRRYLKSEYGWINFTLCLRTESGNVEQYISFINGDVKVSKVSRGPVDVEMICLDNSILKSMATLPPNEVLNLVLKNKLMVRGNLAYAQIFSFFISAIAKNKQIRMMLNQKNDEPPCSDQTFSQKNSLGLKKNAYLKSTDVEPGVIFLKKDPFLSEYSLKDFTRLEKLLDHHFTKRPEICPERPLLLTEWFHKNGFD